ncbi:MAG: hypothetical protein AAFN30_19425 [Actinomycetota bacterium]
MTIFDHLRPQRTTSSRGSSLESGLANACPRPDMRAPAPPAPPADVDRAFAARAARYLGDQGLDGPAIAIALQVELGLGAAESIRLVQSIRQADHDHRHQRCRTTAINAAPAGSTPCRNHPVDH